MGVSRRLYQEAVSFLTLMPQDCAFMPGMTATVAYCLVHTTAPMVYLQSCGTSFVEKNELTPVTEGVWIAEAALWTEWTHVGKLAAGDAGQLLTVDAWNLEDLLSSFTHIAQVMRHYAREFCVRLQAASPPFSPWPSDLLVPGADPDHMLSEQAYCGLLTREWTSGRLNMREECYQELLVEVNSGKSALISLPGRQGLQRVMFICALKLERLDGNILVQVGKWTKASGVSPTDVVLPGLRHQRSGRVQNTGPSHESERETGGGVNLVASPMGWITRLPGGECVPWEPPLSPSARDSLWVSGRCRGSSPWAGGVNSVAIPWDASQDCLGEHVFHWSHVSSSPTPSATLQGRCWVSGGRPHGLDTG